MKVRRKKSLSVMIILLLIIFAWWYIFAVDKADLGSVFSEKNREFTQNFIANLLGANTENPAFLDPEAWKEALLRSIDTIIMSIIAVFLSMFGVMVCFFSTVKRISSSRPEERTGFEKFIHAFVNILFTLTRAVPELLWATILVFIMRPGIFTGALALAINHFGTLGKITSEQLEHVDSRPFKHLKSSGASDNQVLIYGVIPKILPKFLGNVFYRWEEIIRSSVVVGFVGTGGLGQALQMTMSWRQFTSVFLYLICYLIVVYLIDGISALAKQYIRN